MSNLALKIHYKCHTLSHLSVSHIISLTLEINFQRLTAGITSWQKSVVRRPTRLPLVNVRWQGMVRAVSYIALCLLNRCESGIHFLFNTLLESKWAFFPKRTIITLNWIPRRLVLFCSLCWSFAPIVSGLLFFSPLLSLCTTSSGMHFEKHNIYMHHHVWLRVSV